jgi:hypothetical protein
MTGLLFLLVTLGLIAGSPVLVWKSNNAGLFSHFFQAKYMNSIAASLNRSLHILPFLDSFHTSKNRERVNLCDVIYMDNITCGRHRAGKCVHTWKEVETLAGEVDVCFGGFVFGTNGVVPLKYKIEVLDYPPQLKFKEKYVNYFTQVKANIFGVHGAMPFYITVHWRRGDQLDTRCKSTWFGLLDSSLNCKSVKQFIDDITGVVSQISMLYNIPHRDIHVLVATNEYDDQVLKLLKVHNFLLVSESTRNMFNISLDSMEQFAVEALFMLDADVLLTFGVSQVNDVLEHARRLHNKSWCVYNESSRHDNWCQLERNRTRLLDNLSVGAGFGVRDWGHLRAFRQQRSGSRE